MKKREKAQDTFNESNFIFGQKVSFAEAFPEIEDIIVELKESGTGSEWSRNRILHIDNISEYINCSNPICYNGGFSIGDMIRKMILGKKTEIVDYAICVGYEGSPKGHGRYRACVNGWDIKVSIKYKGAFAIK